MNKYRYPTGAEIDGQTLAAPAVLAPCRCRIDGILHGPEICELWSPEALAELGIKRVVADPLPVDDTGWPYLPGKPKDVEGETEIRRTYPSAKPDVEGSAANLAQLGAGVRAQRTARLAACDWTQLPDADMTPAQRSAWGEYRQALRAVPEQAGYPLGVVWPVPPGA